MTALTLKLLLAHFIGDFLIQPDHWAREKASKGYRSKYIYFHLLIHLVAMFCLLQFETSYILPLLMITISHYFIDLVKIRLQNSVKSTLLLILDQTAHIMVILVIVYYYHPFDIPWEYIFSVKTLTLVLFLILVSAVTAVLMRGVMAEWDLPEDSSEDSLKNGGKVIGILERLFVFGFIVLNQWQAIGLLIAAKSVLRFGDLSRAKDRKLTEYILIGTLMSFGIAIAIGLLYKKIAQQL